jgi:Tol biopolymer transport system component
VFSAFSADYTEPRAAILSLKTGLFTKLSIPGVRFAIPFGVFDNSVLYRDSVGAVWSVPVDFQSQRTTGPATRIDASNRLSFPLVVRLARNGTLLYTRSGDRVAMIMGAGATRPDTMAMDAARDWIVPRWSPDGRAVAILSIGPEPGLHVVDRQSRTLTRLTTWRSDLPPVWSTDGTRVTSTRAETADSVAWWFWRDGRAAPDRLVSAPSGWSMVECLPSPDQRLVAMGLERDHVRSIFVSPVGGGPSDAKLLVENAGSPRWSPDGNWIAYETVVGGKSQIVAQRYPVGGRVQLSDDGATHPVWARSGTAIYYESGRDVDRVELEATPGGLRVQQRERVWSGDRTSERGDAPFTNYDISPSGELLVFAVAATGRTEVVVELNWGANVRR